MRIILSATLLALLCFSCNPSDNTPQKRKAKESLEETSEAGAEGQWKGSFSNGMKGAKLSFEVSGNELKDLTFEGYWHCDGKLDLTTIGPEKSFTIKSGKVDGVIVEPEDGMAPFRYEIHGRFDGEKASGTLKIDNVPAGCTTYKLNWTAEKN
jgi:hypothetical protein